MDKLIAMVSKEWTSIIIGFGVSVVFVLEACMILLQDVVRAGL